MLIVGPAHSIVVTKREAPYVIIDTSMGKITVELYWDHAPKTCQNFASLAARGYYNNTKFHRIIPDFMVQVSACLHLCIYMRPRLLCDILFVNAGVCVHAVYVFLFLSRWAKHDIQNHERTCTHNKAQTLTTTRQNQGGDPTATGKGGDSIYGSKFEDELHRFRRNDMA